MFLRRREQTESAEICFSGEARSGRVASLDIADRANTVTVLNAAAPSRARSRDGDGDARRRRRGRHVNSATDTRFRRRKKNIGSKFPRDGRAALYLLSCPTSRYFVRSLARSLGSPDDLSRRLFFPDAPRTTGAIEPAFSPDTVRSIDSAATCRDVLLRCHYFGATAARRVVETAISAKKGKEKKNTRN